MSLTERELERYSRQLVLPELSGAAQECLRSARVMLIHGEGDPGAPVEQALRMRQALIKAGNVPAWVAEYIPEKKGELLERDRFDLALNAAKRGERRESHRLGAYEQLLAFFARHLDTTMESSGGS